MYKKRGNNIIKEINSRMDARFFRARRDKRDFVLADYKTVDHGSISHDVSVVSRG